MRIRLHLATKVFDNEHGFESTKKAVQSSLDNFGFGMYFLRSQADETMRLMELCIDYIDLYLIHSPLSGKERRLETYRALLDLKKEGKIRTIGVSN